MHQTDLPTSKAPSTAAHVAAVPDDRPVQRTRSRTIVLIVIGVACVCAIARGAGAVHRVRNSRALAQSVQQSNAPPIVNVIRPVPATQASLSLPGTTQAIVDAVIYARTSGYLSKRHIDIGDSVKTGQLLA